MTSSLILKVPFFKQTSKTNCGPCALKMVLSYFEENYPIGLIEKKVNISEGKGVSTIQIATASALLDHKTDFFSKNLGFNPEHLKMEFYKKYSEDLTQTSIHQLIQEAKNAGVKTEEKSISLKKLLSYLTTESVPIVLIDWSLIDSNKKNYCGHFVPIVGYDSEFVYIHNQGLKKSQEFMQIKRELFDLARKSNGTDEDIVIIYRENNFLKK